MAEALTGSTPQLNWDAGDLPKAWQTFRTHVEFMFNGPLKSKSEEEKVNYLMIWVGDKGREIYGTWTLTNDEKKSLEAHYNKFKAYVEPKSNRVFARYKFQCIVQSNGDTIEQFVTALKVGVKDCGYGDKANEMVRDRIVFGVKSDKIREKLINEGSDLTLERAIDIARTYETSRAQLKSMTSEDPKIDAINKQKINRGNRPEKKFSQKPGKSANDNFSRYSYKSCGRCGLPEHEKDEICPAIGKLCRKCDKKDHYERMCKTKIKTKHAKPKHSKHVHMVDRREDDSDSESTDDDETLFLGMLTSEMYSIDSDWSTSLMVNGTKVDFQLDTGAKCNVLNRKTFNSLGITTVLPQPAYRLKSYSGHAIEADGVIWLTVSHDGNDYLTEFYIVNLDAPNVIGAKSCKFMNLVHCVRSIEANKDFSVVKNLSTIFPGNDYADLFEGLGCLPGTHSIKLDPKVTPVVHPPRKIPISLMDKVRAELNRMEEMGVIVKQTEPTQWVNSMVVVNKGQKIRICIDPKDLNGAVLREHFPLKTIDDVISNMPNAKVFSKLDAVSGFWQIQLDDESSKLCTFNTPFGRYRFTRLPFGIKSASEVFQKITSEMVADINGAEAIIDDILVWGATQEEHDERLRKVLDKAREYNLKLSVNKCEISRDSIKYVGHILSSEGVKPDPEKIRAVLAMKKPTNKPELLTFLGFIQYLGKFMPRMSDVSTPLRKLTEHSAEWIWSRQHDVSFETLKTMATNAPVLKYYDPNLPLTLSVDASSKGVGAVLIQEGKPVAYGSRALTSSQQNYAQIEKETLAVVYGCEKFHQYIFGRTVHVETDHKPLQSIFSKPLHKAPMRLQRLLLTVQKYDLKVQYKPGKLMFMADHLSRSFLPETKETLIPDVEVNSISPATYLPLSQERYLELQQKTASDEVLQMLRETVQKGWPSEKARLPNCLHPYWSFRDEISCLDGLLYKGPKLIIPKSMQSEMLDIIHQSHLGIVKCKSRAREVLYWPGMSSQIEEKVANCAVCAEIQNSNPKEPLVTVDIPDRPWAKVATDLFVLNSEHYILTVDYFSKWPEVMKLTELSAKYIIAALKSQFAKYGIPDEVFSDNGPQYACREFREFARDYGFKHSTSSPYYAQSNGQAERTVQTVKRLLKKADDPYKSLMDYRNTPLEGIGQSPAQLFLGRRIKTLLPTTSVLLSPSNANAVQEKLQMRQGKNKYYYDRKASNTLSELKSGDSVVMQEGGSWKHATVESKHPAERSYVVRTTDDKRYRRNRKMLKPTKSSPSKSYDITVKKSYLDPETISTTPHDDVPTLTSPSKVKPVSPVVSKPPDITPNIQQTRSGRIVKKPAKLADFDC